MELSCFVYPGWEPRIRPAAARRGWMDDAPESFPYRCLPLGIANSHGWEILSSCGFEAVWNGGNAVEDVTVTADADAGSDGRPVALFGQGTFTLHIAGLLRTSPGWNLYVSGPPNSFKDGVAPLTGIIETDWSPYSFTMNWRLTRPHHPVRFEENEPIAHIFPVQRGLVESLAPTFVPIDEAPELKAMFEQWSRSRDAFQAEVRAHPPEKPSDRWQKLYYRGQNPDGTCPVADHRTKLQVRPFAHAELTGGAPDAMAKPAQSDVRPRVTLPPAAPRSDHERAKYEWLLDTLERQRALSANASEVFVGEELTSEEFLDEYYAPGRPVVIAGEIGSWPALTRWNPAYLRDKLGSVMIEYQGGRTASVDFERYKDVHKRQMPFDRFIEMIETEPGNDAYLTAYNSAGNAAALAPLQADIGRLDKFLAQDDGDPGGMMWIGPQGTFTALHHDLTNNLLVQVIGSKRVVLAAATELPKLYNDRHVFSTITDVTDPGLDLNTFSNLQNVRFHEVILQPGEALFIPIGWWHQVESLDFSVSITYTNFNWKNDFFREYPAPQD
ncbi:MAG: cupin-like protein [Bradyrhizobium sp.]|nr:cupin-like protein [Bradyrhizobium sp.]